MNILGVPSLPNFRAVLTAVLTAALVGGSLIAVAPAQAAAGTSVATIDASTGDGSITCTGSGSARVESFVVMPPLSGFTDCVGSISIPKEITGIEAGAFYFGQTSGVSDLTEIIFESGSLLTSIGYGAFERAGLTSIEFPEAVTGIQDYAFINASDLTSVTFKGDQLISIGMSAFEGLTSLQQIVIPASVQFISSSAFYGNVNLSSVTFASGSLLEFIGNQAFSGVSNLPEISLPSHLTTIGSGAFAGASALSNILFLGPAPGLGLQPFFGIAPGATAQVLVGSLGYSAVDTPWNGLIVKNVINVPCSTSGSVTLAGPVVAGQVDCVGSVRIPNTVSSIASNVFNGNRFLTSIDIPAGVTEIGASAFKSTNDLTTVTFAEGSLLTTIGSGAFNEALKLTAIEIPAGVTRIENNTFALTFGLISPTFATGSSLTSIGRLAFAQSGLSDITIPAGVTSIEGTAFRQAGNLVTVTFLGNAPTVVGDSTAPFPNDEESIKGNSFYGINANAVAKVGAEATGFGITGSVWNNRLFVIQNPDIATACSMAGFFWVRGTVIGGSKGCAGEATIPSTITEIATGAFKDSPVESVTQVEDSQLATIGASAFDGASELDRFFVAQNVSSIGANAFRNTQKLTRFTVSDQNLYFTENTDGVLLNYDQTKLIAYPASRTNTSYVIPDGITEIGESAFYGASRIFELVFSANAPVVGAEAFFGITPRATAKVSYTATGFEPSVDGTWNGLIIVRASAPSGPPSGDTGVNPPVLVAPKPVAKPIALNEIVAKLRANGVPVLKGRSASKQVQFRGSSARLDATDMSMLRKVADRFTGKRGKLILVGFVNGKGQNKTSAQKIATKRAKNVALALINLGVDFEVRYVGFGVRNKAKPSASNNRVNLRWIAEK